MKLKIFLIKLINFYQRRISIWKSPSCKFYPTCSEYGKSAIKKYGPAKGSWLTILRILRCHPWQKHKVDLVK